MAGPRYEIVEKIGEGGMAEVFKAWAIAADGSRSTVVLKRILSHLSDDPNYRAMFVDEARIAFTLEHPNIVRLLDLGRMEGKIFLVFEFVEGPDMRAVLVRCAQTGIYLSTPGVLFAVREILNALDYAHSHVDPDGSRRPIVHRDVSPQNILVSRAGAVKLLDFGIAKKVGVDSRTVVGTLKGNALYFSPEQARGMPVDARADVYQSGLLLLTLLCGRHPFEDESLHELVDRARMAAVPRVTDFRPDLPAFLDELVSGATTRDPGKRYPSAAAFARLIEATASREKIALEPRALLDDLQRAFSGATEIPSAFSSGLFSVASLGPKTEVTLEPLADPADGPPGLGEFLASLGRFPLTRTATSTTNTATAASAPAALPLSGTATSTTTTTTSDSSPGRVPLSGTATATTTSSPDPSGGAPLLATATSTTRTTTQTAPAAVPVDPDSYSDTRISVSPPIDSASTSIPIPEEDPTPQTRARAMVIPGPPSEAETGPRLSTRVPAPAVQSGDVEATPISRVRILGPGANEEDTTPQTRVPYSPSAETTRTRPPAPRDPEAPISVLAAHTGAVRGLGTSAAAARAISVGDDGMMRIWDLTAMKLVSETRAHGSGITACALTGDGLMALTAGRDRKLSLWALRTPGDPTPLVGHAGTMLAVALSPDGSAALAGGEDPRLRMWELGRRRITATFSGHTASIRAALIFPDRMRALSAGDDGTIRLWSVETGDEMGILKEGCPVRSLALTPDGGIVLAGREDGKISVWNLAGSARVHQGEGHRGRVIALGLSSDGATAYSGGEDGMMLQWDVRGGVVQRRLNAHAGGVTAITVPFEPLHPISAGADGTVKAW